MTTGLILGATYMLWLYRKVIFGTLEKEAVKALQDMNLREKLTFVPLLILVFWMGIYPKPFFDFMHASVAQITDVYGTTEVQALPRDYTETMGSVEEAHDAAHAVETVEDAGDAA